MGRGVCECIRTKGGQRQLSVSLRADKCKVAFPGSSIILAAVKYGRFLLRDRSIRGLTIDSLKLENVGLIKIDTQGCELHVLRGAAKTIERCHPVIIFEHELQLARAQGWELAECEEFFEGLY